MTVVHDRPTATATHDQASPPAAVDRRPPRRRRWAIAGAVVVVALLAMSQLVLPALAEHGLRSHLEGTGTVSQVKVSAFPAVKLLWGQPDHATIRMARVDAGPLSLQDVRVNQHGHAVDATAVIPRSQLPPLPPGLDLRTSDLPGGRLLLDAAASALRIRGDQLHPRTVEAKQDPQGLVLRAAGTLD